MHWTQTEIVNKQAELTNNKKALGKIILKANIKIVGDMTYCFLGSEDL